jgi:hypothetical protein
VHQDQRGYLDFETGDVWQRLNMLVWHMLVLGLVVTLAMVLYLLPGTVEQWLDKFHTWIA